MSEGGLNTVELPEMMTQTHLSLQTQSQLMDPDELLLV